LKKLLLILTTSAILAAGCAGAQIVRPETDGTKPKARDETPALPRVLTLEKALDLALASPRVKAALGSVAAAEGDVRQASVAPNPTMSLSTESLSPDKFDWGDAVTKVHLSQQLELGGKRGARTRLAHSRKALAQAEYEVLVTGTRLEITLAFNNVLYVGEKAELLKELLEATQKLHELAEAKLQTGRISRREFLQFDVALGSAKLEHQNAAAALAPAMSALAAAMGIDPGNFPVESCEGTLGPAGLEAGEGLLRQVKEELLERNPGVLAARERLKVAGNALAHERARRWPDLTVGLMYARVEPKFQDAVGASLGMPLPLWDSNRGAVSAASARLDAARSELTGVHYETVARFENLREQFLTARRSVEVHEKEIVPRAKESYDIAYAAFEAGRLSYVETLTPLISLLEAKKRLLEWLRQLADTEAGLRAMTVPPE